MTRNCNVIVAQKVERCDGLDLPSGGTDVPLCKIPRVKFHDYSDHCEE